METQAPRGTVEAIFQLRAAVEAKAQAEHDLEAHPTPEARDALLNAQLDVEARTQDTIDACHNCGEHTCLCISSAGDRVVGRSDNVVEVDFSGR